VKKIHYLFLFLSLTLGLLLRLYHLTWPVADWHSFRQVDTASVTQNFINKGVDFLRPTYQDLSSNPSGIDNPQGYRMVEFPLYNYLCFLTTKITGLGVDVSSRITSIIFNLLSALTIFALVFSLTKSFSPAFLSLLVFLFLPFNIYYARTILPENAAVFFMLFSLFLFRRSPVFSAIFLAASALCKPFTLLISLPLFFYLSLRFKYLKSRRGLINLFIFFIISLAPLLLWRRWISNFPEGIPFSKWLFNFSDKRIFPEWYRGFHVDFLNQVLVIRPYWWRWLFDQRISQLILGAFGLIPLFLGLIYRKNNIGTFNLMGLIGIFIYFVFIPGGNIQHDYYQVLIIPVISIAVGCGLYYLYHFTFSSKILSVLSLLFISALSLLFSSELVWPYYQINHPEIITAGQMVDQLTPQDSLIIAPYNGDTALLYQTKRSGFPIQVYDIDTLKTRFGNYPLYFVSVSFDDYTNKVIKLYPTLYRNDQFIILDLNQ
jgi:hypothetical protein